MSKLIRNKRKLENMTMTPAKTRKLQEILNTCDTDDLDTAFAMFKARRRAIAEQTTLTLRKGQKVQFDRGPRRGGMVKGKITKVNTKTVKVDVGGGMVWTVGATLVETV